MKSHTTVQYYLIQFFLQIKKYFNILIRHSRLLDCLDWLVSGLRMAGGRDRIANLEVKHF
jgi:hypothetical protein